MGTVELSIEDMKILLQSAKKTGKLEQWTDLAIEWIEHMEEQYNKLKEGK